MSQKSFTMERNYLRAFLMVGLLIMPGVCSGCATRMSGTQLRDLVWKTTRPTSIYNDVYYVGTGERFHEFHHKRSLKPDRSYRVPVPDPLIIKRLSSPTNDQSDWVHLSERVRWKQFFDTEYPKDYHIGQRIPDWPDWRPQDWRRLGLSTMGTHTEVDGDDNVRRSIQFQFEDGPSEEVEITFTETTATIRWREEGRVKKARQTDLHSALRKAGFRIK